MIKKILPAFLFLISIFTYSQQNQQLYLMHYLPESNFLNPAVQPECKWFIGLPFISSIHENYANSAFSYNNILTKGSDGFYHPDEAKIDQTVNRLGRRSFIGEEFHTTLLALGYRREYNYFNFSVIEKINTPLTVSKEAFMLAWKGNSQFEGDYARLKGTSSYMTHYREYAFGYSTLNNAGDFVGIKGKLLFGKLNVSTPVSDYSLYTDPNTFDLLLDGEVQANISAPVIITQDSGQITEIVYDESVSVSRFLLNRKNWGLAFDFGIIHEYSDKITLSASILDLGFIRWRSYLNNVGVTGKFDYDGVQFDSGNAESFFDNLQNTYTDSFQYNVTQNPYFTMMPVKIYAGANYKLTEKFVANLVLSGVYYRSKLLTAATIGLDYNPLNNFHIVGSYSLMYRSFKIAGLGFSFGKGPLQFYAISDNVCGFIWPLSARNINLRFGLNINLGCNVRNPNESARAYNFIKDACKVFDDTDKVKNKKTKHNK